MELDLGTVEPTLAGPKRPQDRVSLKNAKSSFTKVLEGVAGKQVPVKNNGDAFELSSGAVVIAAITSCTNTSNPSLMLGAGLLAKKAVERGLQVKPWVKTSLAPGSKVVTDYLKAAGLNTYLDQLKFNLVGYGCTTCIGNSGPLPEAIGAAIKENNMVAVAVLSGNRNFEGRVHPLVRANYLASPPLVVAYALAGRMDLDLTTEPLGLDKGGKAVYLKDIWPTPQEVEATVRAAVTSEQYRKVYSEVFEGDARIGKRCRFPRVTFISGTRIQPTLNWHRILKTCQRTPRRWPIFTERVCWQFWETVSRPTTFLQPARLPSILPRENI